jgi:hypothetical protein
MSKYGKQAAGDGIPDPFVESGHPDDYYPTNYGTKLTDGEIIKSFHSNKFAGDMWEILDSAGNLLLSKHKDYGPTNISHSPGGPLNGLRVRMHDKTARINHLIDSGATPENESLRDSFIDLLNYSAIALMVLDGKWPND